MKKRLANISKIKYILLIAIIFFSSINVSYTSYCASKSFSDVKETNWYYNDLMVLTNKNIIDGFTDGTFKPNGILTRSQFIKLLVCTVNPYKEFIKDSKSWFNPYLESALEMGIIDYADKYINFNAEITREETAHYAYIAMNLGKQQEREERIEVYLKDKENVISSIKDYDKISKEYQEEIFKVYKAEIIKGYKDGTFGPDNQLTRAEVTAIIRRIIDYRNDLKRQRLIKYEEIPGYIFSDNIEEYNLPNIDFIDIYG